MTKNKLTDMISLNEIIQRTSRRLCLLCETKLDNELGEGRWHIPLCKKHRLMFLFNYETRGEQ